VEAERLLRFSDGGDEKNHRGAVTPAVREAVRQIVSLGEARASFRLSLAGLLRRRLGDVFSVVDKAIWRGLEKERTTLRRWVAGEILDILFRNLVPDNEFRHQTRARQKFWRKYTHRVERMWLLIHPDLRSRMERGSVRDLLEKVGSVVEVRTLEGQDEQAIVWMHLQANYGGTVTVIDGNANSSFRAREGALSPPHSKYRGRSSPVNYSRDIVRGPFAKRHPEVAIRPHRGDWTTKVENDLNDLGVTQR